MPSFFYTKALDELRDKVDRCQEQITPEEWEQIELSGSAALSDDSKQLVITFQWQGQEKRVCLPLNSV